jgi:hypothetical protein
MSQIASPIIALFALLVALGSLSLAYSADRRARMPVLQFFWSSPQGAVKSAEEDHGWILRNVGAGPALSVIVAVADRTSLRPGVTETWRNPMLIPAIPAGGQAVLRWLGDADSVALGAGYTDARRYFFTTKCGDDVSLVFVGLHMPRWPLLKLHGRKHVEQWWGYGNVRQGDWSVVSPAEARRRWWLMRRYGVCRRMGGWADPVRLYQRKAPR